MKKGINALLVIIAMVLFLVVAGCGQDPAKLPPDQLLQKAFENARKTPGAYEIKETLVVGSGANTVKLETSSIMSAPGDKSYVKSKGFPDPNIDMEVFYEKEEKNIYVRLTSGSATILTKSPKDVGNEYALSYGPKFLGMLQDVKQLTDLKVTQEGDQLIVESKPTTDSMGYLRLKNAALRYFIDRKTVTLQKIEASVANLDGGQLTGTYTYKAGLQVPVLSQEEKAKAIQQ